MNPGVIGLGLLVFTITFSTVNIIFPTMNMHLRVNRTAIFKQKIARKINELRHAPSLLDAAFDQNNVISMNDLGVEGIKIHEIRREVQGNYKKIAIEFSEEKLFYNKYFSPADAAKRNRFEFIVDHVGD